MATLQELRARISSGLGRTTPPPPTLDSLKERIKRSQYVPIPGVQGMPKKPAPQAFGSLKRGAARLGQAIAVGGAETGLVTPERAARAIGEAQLDIRAAPAPPEVERGLQEISQAKGFGEALSAIVRNPSAVASVVGESLPQSVPALGLGAIGSLGGPVGTGGGVGAGSALIEYSASLLESLQATGIDPLDDQAVARALSDPDFLAQARDRAAKRGVAIGAFDALTGGLAGRLLGGARGVTSTIARGTGELGIQAAGGAGGEAAAQLVTEGRITAPGEVLLEAAAESLPGVGEVALNLSGQRRGPTRPPATARQEPGPPRAGLGGVGAGGRQEPTGPEVSRPAVPQPGDAARAFVRRQLREIQGRQTPGRTAERGPVFPGRIAPQPETHVSDSPAAPQPPSDEPVTANAPTSTFETGAHGEIVLRFDDVPELGGDISSAVKLKDGRILRTPNLKTHIDTLEEAVRRGMFSSLDEAIEQVDQTGYFSSRTGKFDQRGGDTLEIPRGRLAQGKPAAGPRVRKSPLTLAEFLAARGGVQDQTGELRAMDADKWHRDKPFRRKLVSDQGLAPDYAREAAEEAGYLPQGSDLADLYDALDRDLRGGTVEQGPTVDRAEMENAAGVIGIPEEVVARLSNDELAAVLAHETAIEQTVQGPQRVIPGAGRITDRELAERRLKGRIQPTVPQRAADEGLFDVAGRGQGDIEDILAGRSEPEQVEIPDTVFSQPPTAEALRARIGQARGMAPPGDRYVGSRQDTVEGETPPGGQPIRREDVLRPLLTALNVPLYQGRMKGRKLLGFYRRGIEEVRIKRMNDIEVAAHELAHMLDDRIPEIRQQWLPASKANETIREELRGVSYDRSKLFEGFAEFVRLWATQQDKAREAAPNFYGWFEDFVARSQYGPALRKAQADMHAWFAQDAVSRARSKIGLTEDINAGLTPFWDRFRQGVSDDLHGIYRMERELTGDISPVGPYETARLTRAKYSIIEGAILYGAPVVNPDGSHSYEGKGLQQILDPVAHRLDDFLMYAVGRSANELRQQGREHLFTAAEIRGMRDLETPAFVQAFDDYQVWNRAILDFAEAKGVINPVARSLWKRTQYLPFHRVSQPGAFSPVPGDWKGIKALTGGTDNLRDILSNMIGNAAMLMDAALTNEARVQVAKLAKHRGGAKFMARIPTEERTVKVHQAEIERTILEALGVRRKSQLPVELQSFLDSIMANLGGFVPLIQRGQAPFGGNVVAVLHAGKPIYYEVADPLLYSALTHLNRPARHGLINILGGFKRLGQASITLSIDFLTANIARDTLMGFVMSRTGFKPFVDSARGLKSRLTSDQNYRDFIANGGGFSSYFVDETAFRKHLERFYTKRGINYRTVLDSPAKLLYAVERIADSFEMATRLGEFRRARAQDQHPRHAAYLGREVSTDFAMRGDWVPLGAAYDTIIFLKAAVNGMDRLYRGVTKDPNRLSVAGKTAAIAMLSMGLASLWRGIPEWDDMEDWDRDTHWHFFVPTPETIRAWSEGRPLPPIDQRYEHFRYPKIWEIGAVASLAERTMQRLLDDDAGQLPEDFARILMDTFRLEYLPQFLAPVAEAGVPFTEFKGLNRLRFFDRPIQSERLLDLQPWARAAPYTSHTLRKLGEASRDLPRGLQPVPVQVEALLRGFFNTWALYGLTLSDALFFDDAPSLRLDQMPGIRRFYRETPGRSKYVNEFYDMVKEATEARRTMREMARRYQPDVARELAHSPANLEYGQLSRAQKGMQRLGAVTRLVLNAPDLATLQQLAVRMGQDRRMGSDIQKILRSKSGRSLGDLKRDLRDLLFAEQNKLAKTVVESVKGRRELVTVQ